MLRRLLMVLILAAAFGMPALGQAQTLSRVSTPSGRLSLEIPEIWVSRPLPEEQEIQGLDSETLVVGTSYDVIDGYLKNENFDGTLIFLSAYPYHVFDPAVLGDAVKMLIDVTVLDETKVKAKTLAGYPAAEFYFEQAGVFFAIEALIDTGELAYRTTIYSTRFDEYELVETILNSLTQNPFSLEDAVATDQATREVTTEDNRLSFEIPRSWLYWNESATSVGFATSGTGYAGISYSYQPKGNEEIAFIVQRLVVSALRADEVIDETPDLSSIANRVRDEGGGLKKNSTLSLTDFDGHPMLDTSWLVTGEKNSVLTRTRLLDGGDAVYLIQAQYDASQATQFQPIIDSIFGSMAYAAPDELLDPNEVGIEVGNRAPDFSLQLLDGAEVSLADYRGKVILMNMWASWCKPCHREAPAMQVQYDNFAGRFEILGVNIAETSVEARGFQQEYNLTFPILLDEQHQVADLYGLVAYPTTYIIGRDGVIIEKIMGSLTEQSLRDILAIYVGD